MDRQMENTITFLALIAILLFLGLVWFLIAAAIAAWRYHQYHKQAEADFEQIAREQGLNFDPDDVIHTVFGAGIHLPHDGHQNVGEWAAGSLFGVEEYEEQAI